MNSSINSLTAKQLRTAADLKEKIDSLQGELLDLLGSPTPTVVSAGGRRKGTMSAAGRARIAAAARARWARIRKGNASSAAAPKRRRKLSPAARARLSAIAKARWKRVKSQGKSAL